MSLLPAYSGSHARWLVWSVFWSGFHYFGSMQTWAFGDHTNKPALYEFVGPLHFWFPWVLFQLPISPLMGWLVGSLNPYQHSITWLFDVGAVIWSIVVSRSIVLVQDRLHPRLAARFTWWSIGGIVAILVALRLMAANPRDVAADSYSGNLSMVLLSGLVLATGAYIVFGLLTIIVRRLWPHPAPRT